jgi:hypothetical protein
VLVISIDPAADFLGRVCQIPDGNPSDLLHGAHVLIAGAVIFGKFLAVTRIPFEIADWVSGLPIFHR